MNLKLNVFRKIIAIAASALMITGAAVPAYAGKRRVAVRNAKSAKLANKFIPKRVSETLIHKDIVDDISKKIDELAQKLENEISEYYAIRKDFESQIKCADANEEEIDLMDCSKKEFVDFSSGKQSNNVLNALIKREIRADFLRNSEEYDNFQQAWSQKIYEENLKKSKENIVKLKAEYISKYDDLIQEFKTLKSNMLNHTHQPAIKRAIEDQINILRNKINSTNSKIHIMNINFSMCGLYDCLTKFNINGIINDLSYKNSNNFNESLQMTGALNLKLEKTDFNNLTESDRSSLISNLNVLNNSFDNLDSNAKIQTSLNLLNIKKLLDIFDKNPHIYQNNNVSKTILDKAKKTLLDYICEFLKFNSMNYLNDEDINNYLTVFSNNEYIYNSKNISELEQTVFNIFKLTNKNLLDHKYSELVNLPRSSKRIKKEACRLIVSDLKISIMNILGKLDNILNSGENPEQNMAGILEKVVQNIKSFNKTFNADQNKDKLNNLCDFLTKTNLKIQNLQNQLKNYMNIMCEQDQIYDMIKSIHDELNKVLTQEIDNMFK